MGENTKVIEQHSEADKLREQIRHTESDITETVGSLEHKLSPGYLKQQGARKVKLYAWQGAARFLEVAQKRSVQMSLLGASALLMILGTRKGHRAARRPAVTGFDAAGSAAKALGSGALWMLTRKRTAKEPGEKPAISGMALAATLAKAFLGGARRTEKSGTTRPVRKDAWRGLATAIGAALGSSYGHRGHRA